MDKSQKAFLKTLLKSVDQAKQTQAAILQALNMGVENKAVCKAYVQALQQYINDCQRMVLECTIAYGKGADRIAVEAKPNTENLN